MSAAEQTRQMNEIWLALGDQERTAVIRIAERIYKGQLMYSKLDLVNDKRNFQYEISQELDDAEIYDVYDGLRADLKSAGGK